MSNSFIYVYEHYTRISILILIRVQYIYIHIGNNIQYTLVYCILFPICTITVSSRGCFYVQSARSCTHLQCDPLNFQQSRLYGRKASSDKTACSLYIFVFIFSIIQLLYFLFLVIKSNSIFYTEIKMVTVTATVTVSLNCPSGGQRPPNTPSSSFYLQPDFASSCSTNKVVRYFKNTFVTCSERKTRSRYTCTWQQPAAIRKPMVFVIVIFGERDVLFRVFSFHEGCVPF